MPFRDRDLRSFRAGKGCCITVTKRFSSAERETHSSFDFNYTIGAGKLRELTNRVVSAVMVLLPMPDHGHIVV